MTRPIRLDIDWHRSSAPAQPGPAQWGVIVGGPEQLLRWLETQLGLACRPIAAATRISQYAARLAAVGTGAFAASFAVDRWATAKELLARRDELRLLGWNGADDARLPPLLRDLARAERIPMPLAPIRRKGEIPQYATCRVANRLRAGFAT